MALRPPILLCVAAPAECHRVLAAFDACGPTTPGSRSTLIPATGDAPGVELLATGVGPTSAGVSAARSLALAPASAVVSLGIAGAYPGSGVSLLQTVCSTRSILAGEGRAEADAFVGLAGIGFGPFAGGEHGVDWADTSPEVVDRLRLRFDASGPIATVSAVSGTDPLAAELADRTGALAEAMEGAAVHLACQRQATPFAEVRVISNTVGDRDRHPWRLGEALDRLGPLARAVVEALRGVDAP